MKILFLCTGNTCRSKMAEAIFESINKDKGISAFSAGVFPIEGSTISLNASKVIMENTSIDYSNHLAVGISRDTIREVDLVLTMTEELKNIFIAKFPELKTNVFTLNGYVSLNSDIIDPFGGNIEVYKNCFNQIYNSIILLQNKLEGDNGI